jgi:hypothetical protein
MAHVDIKILSSIILILGMSPALECNAQMHHQMIGGGLGLISANRGVGMGFGYGLNHAHFLSPLWGAGAFVRSSNHSQGITQFGFGLEGLYLADRILPGLSLGAHLGAVKFSGGGFDGDFHVAGGLKASYDYPLPTETSMSVGLDGGIQWTQPASQILSISHILLTAKFFFGS